MFTIDNKLFYKTIKNEDSLSSTLNQASQQLAQRKDLGFLTLGQNPELCQNINLLSEEFRNNFEHLIVLGIGGSSLGCQTIIEAFPSKNKTISFLDNVDPFSVEELLSKSQPEKTCVAVITKSGGTAETLALFLCVYDWLKSTIGSNKAKDHLIFITDPEKGFLRELSLEFKVPTLEVPSLVGGRFSVLTPVGLFPAAFAGIDPHELLQGSEEVLNTFFENSPNNYIHQITAPLFMALKNNINNLVFMPYSDRLPKFGAWFVQLWAESLGKFRDRNGKVVRTGQTPIFGRGTTDQHSQVQLFIEGPKDKSVLLLGIEKHSQLLIPTLEKSRQHLEHLEKKPLAQLLNAKLLATQAALFESEIPVSRLMINELSPKTLGALFMLFQCSCALMGEILNINAFDQPGVELGKKLTNGLMGKKGFEEYAQRVNELLQN